MKIANVHCRLLGVFFTLAGIMVLFAVTLDIFAITVLSEGQVFRLLLGGTSFLLGVLFLKLKPWTKGRDSLGKGTKVNWWTGTPY